LACSSSQISLAALMWETDEMHFGIYAARASTSARKQAQAHKRERASTNACASATASATSSAGRGTSAVTPRRIADTTIAVQSLPRSRRVGIVECPCRFRCGHRLPAAIAGGHARAPPPCPPPIAVISAQAARKRQGHSSSERRRWPSQPLPAGTLIRPTDAHGLELAPTPASR